MIGVITFHHSLNCGALLQAWALRKYLRILGHKVDIVNYRKIGWNELFAIDKRNFRAFIRSTYYTIRIVTLNLLPELLRRRQFRRFLSENMKIGRSVSREDLPRLGYSHWICGSDQIWNPKFNGNDETFFLDFVPEGGRRIAYGPSFGTESFTPESSRRIGELLKRFDRISVRERTGVEIVRNLCGKSAELVCDPTMLLGVDSYQRLERVPIARLPNRYVAVYLVGAHTWALQMATKVAKDRNASVVLLQGGMMARWHTSGEVNRISVLGPSEWLYFIHHAEFLVTNSFHGTVFALQYHVPFTVTLNRTAGDERMLTLLSAVGQPDRALSQSDQFVQGEINWSSVDGLIEEMRAKGGQYLKEALT